MRFFRAKTEEEFMTVAQTNPAINEAWGLVKVLSGDERARAMAEAREKAQMDLDSFIGGARQEGLLEGLEKGREEGLEKGREEGIAVVARNLLQDKTPLEVVSRVTGLPLEEVNRLAGEVSRR
jgi:predicted transposase/invertase (TIGR01784 family)